VVLTERVQGTEMTAGLPVEVPTTPQVFGISQGHEGVSNEIGFTGSLRVALAGTRVVCLAPISAVMRHMKAVAPAGTPKPTPIVDLKKLFWSMGTKDIDALKADLHLATLGIGDVLWTPPHYLVAERIHDDKDVFGVRKAYVMAEDKSNYEIFAGELKSFTGAESGPLRALVRALGGSSPEAAGGPHGATGAAASGAAADAVVAQT